MMNKQPAVVPDIYADSRIPADAYRPTFVKSLAMVPVRASDPIAAIGAYWATQRRASDDEIQIMQTIADCAAVAIANIQLLAELKATAERERAARQEAESANRAKDEFLSVVSHELRTPLTPVYGWIKIISRQTLPPEMARGVAVMERNLELQKRVVDDLLDFSRMITGKIKVNLQPTRFNDCIEAALESIRPAAKQRQLDIQLNIEDTIAVNGDADRLQQIVWNLLGNAVKFSFDRGTVIVRLQRKRGLVQLQVEDEGCGIDPAFLPKMFQRFSQYEPATTRQHGGLGLGLSIVRHLVELHGGNVRAESAGIGKGATFTVTLPVLEM
jgi:signal transduction histidine kinase